MNNPMPVDRTSVPVTYAREWQDGFGARGWKLDVSIGDPSVIAATAETGNRIPTSVLVHDILDHHFSGLAVGGHRNEAKALLQLGSRTGSDPRIDYAQIVDEDLLRGHCNGESLADFLPADLRELLPPGVESGPAMIKFLSQELGRSDLRARLIERFWEIGMAAQADVETHWQLLGLDYYKRPQIGLALQSILVRADQDAQHKNWDSAQALFKIGNERCTLEMLAPDTRIYRAEV